MNIAIDYDDTLTADPMLWKAFYDSAKGSGHQLWCVTCRRRTTDNADIVDEFLEVYGMMMPVLFTDMGSKLEFVRKMGLHIDIWIDDMPSSILEGR